METGLLKAVPDLGNIGQGNAAAGLRRYQLYTTILIRPLLPLLHPQQYFPGIGLNSSGRHIFTGLCYEPGYFPERKVVLPEFVPRYLHMSHIIGHIAEFHLCYVRIAEELVAQLFGQPAERPYIGVPVNTDHHYLTLVRLQPHLGLLNIIGESAYTIYRLVDILERFHTVGSGHQLDGYLPGSLIGLRGDLLDTLHASYRFFNRSQNTLLHFGRCGPRINHTHFHHIQLELGKHLFLDVEHRPDSAAEQDNHQQVGGDRVLRHVGNGAA